MTSPVSKHHFTEEEEEELYSPILHLILSLCKDPSSSSIPFSCIALLTGISMVSRNEPKQHSNRASHVSIDRKRCPNGALFKVCISTLSVDQNTLPIVFKFVWNRGIRLSFGVDDESTLIYTINAKVEVTKRLPVNYTVTDSVVCVHISECGRFREN